MLNSGQRKKNITGKETTA